MSDPLPERFGHLPSRATPAPYGQGSSANLADILERVLDKGIVIAGDIRINLLDIELLTIKLRILVASVDKAKEMGIDWWEYDPSLSSRHSGDPLAEENRRLRAELEELRREAVTPGDARRRRASRSQERETDTSGEAATPPDTAGEPDDPAARPPRRRGE
ncbi:gas vesicle protein GvpJ [Streptomyces sp. NPDC004284]|uniref:gas vesicle protein GvpJ n=1 Tax=Streptomyces sp. NPDC004284 TaxID=3364695 RepID=UPI00367E0679